jgi:hypothetical protein
MIYASPRQLLALVCGALPLSRKALFPDAFRFLNFEFLMSVEIVSGGARGS